MNNLFTAIAMEAIYQVWFRDYCAPMARNRAIFAGYYAANGGLL